MRSTTTCSMCLAVLAICCIVSANAQMKLNPNLKMPKSFKSYSQYLKYVGMATGALPLEPEAEASFLAQAPGAALAPVAAVEAQGGPKFQQQPNPNPTIDDWVNAYKPVDDRLNYIFEHRITKDNAQEAQFQLAIAAAPLQMLVNDVTQQQVKEIGSGFTSFAKTLGLTNPLTGTSATAPASATQAATTTTTDGNTVTATAASARAPAAATSSDATTATSATGTTAAAPAAAQTATTTTAAANPFAGLASLFGRKLLKH